MNPLNETIIKIGVILIGEVLLFAIFWTLRMYEDSKLKTNLKSVAKGLFERAFLTITFYLNLPVALVFFSALKLGTRLDEKNKSKYSNDQFLIGNMLSVLATIIYFLALKEKILL